MTKSSVTKYWLVPVPKELKHIAEKLKVPIRDVRRTEPEMYTNTEGGYSIEHSESQLWISAEDLRAVETMAAVLRSVRPVSTLSSFGTPCSAPSEHNWVTEYQGAMAPYEFCDQCGSTRGTP